MCSPGHALHQPFSSFLMVGTSTAILDHEMTSEIEACTWNKIERTWSPPLWSTISNWYSHLPQASSLTSLGLNIPIYERMII